MDVAKSNTETLEKDNKVQKNEKEKGDKEDDLSEEDKQLQDELNMLVERLQESDSSLYKPSLESMRTLIRSSTTSMTSVPKPLKFLRPHYTTIKDIYKKISAPDAKKLCADIISVLGMTMMDQKEYSLDTLRYRFLGSPEEMGSWGHEYVRHLTSQIVQTKDLCENKEASEEEDYSSLYEQSLTLVHQIVPYLMDHNAESEAIDLCMEIERLDLLHKFTTVNNYQRVCLYMISCVPYLSDPDNTKVLKSAADLYRNFRDLGNAMRCSLSLNDPKLSLDIFKEAEGNTSVQKQLAFLLGRQQYIIPYSEVLADNEALAELMGNSKLSEHFLALGRELDIMEPKVAEDIYKSHLEPNRSTIGGASIDSARANLSTSYVNGLVNCGFGKDKLIMEDDANMKWVYKNKDIGMMSTVATLGWILLWDVDSGLSQIDRYLYANVDYVKAGGLLACGVVNSGVKNECDPALALLGDYVESNTSVLSRAAIIGLGVAYAGSVKEDVINKLSPVILDTASDKFELSCLAALSSGLVAVGSLNDEVTSTIIQTMLERPVDQFNSPFGKFMALGLALTCLSRQEEADVILASLEALSEPLKSMAHMLCYICAYAGTGNVLKVQKLLHILSEKYEEKTEEDKSDSKDTKTAKDKKKDESKTPSATKESESMDVDLDASSKDDDQDNLNYLPHQGLAVLGVAVISMGEEIGLDVAFRMFGHLLRYGENPIKRAVPLALGIAYVSNPQLKVLDTLSKFSHDSDQELSYNSILALGLVGAGTNNARLAAMLRQLAIFHQKDPFNLFLVRLAQGLTHLGKGTLTLSPWHSDRMLISPVAMAGLLTLAVSCLDVKKTFMNRHDYLIFYLTPAIQPRLLMTLDEDLHPLTVTVRVGQAVDVVGQAGRPKTITGFQTHTTPVLLSHGERAELATEEYIPVTNLPLEGFVILKKNPDYSA